MRGVIGVGEKHLLREAAATAKLDDRQTRKAGKGLMKSSPVPHAIGVDDSAFTVVDFLDDHALSW